MDIPLTNTEYFAGIGLMRMGIEALGWRVVFANDFSHNKYEMYRAFYPDSHDHYRVDDIFDLDHGEVPLTTLATCSFPCIDLSLAGNMNGMDGQHSSAFWGFTRILRDQGEMAPPILLLENVTGWLSSNGGADFRVTVKALNELGYACDVFILDARRFTPQSRPRVFLVGLRHSAQLVEAEAYLDRSSSLATKRLKDSMIANGDLKWMRLELPEPPELKEKGLLELVEYISEDDPRWWGTSKVEKHLEMMAEAHRDRAYQLADSDDYSYRTFFRRRRDGEQRAEVRANDTAGCLRTAVGGSSKQFLLRAGQQSIRMRTLTPRDYARLQGVPDRYPITVQENQALTGFGDAVCVPAVEWIAEHVLAQLVQRLERLDSEPEILGRLRAVA